MDRDRVKGYFSGSNYDNRNSSTNGFQQPMGQSPTMSFTPPIVSSQGDVPISSPAQKKSKTPFILIGLVLLFVIGFVAYFLLNGGGPSIGGGGKVDEEVLTLSKDSYVEISALQSDLIKAKRGDVEAFYFFSEDNKNAMNNFLQKFTDFNDKIKKYNPSSISNETARESFISLRTAINNDIEKYKELVDLYNLFYDYVSNDYGDSYKEAIKNTNNEGAIKALNNLDAVVNEYGSYEAGTIVYDLFNAALGENYPEVYYYELVGNIIGGLDNEEEE